MSESYDLRSNIKGKPGSQGTLFQVRDKGLLNPAQRWPRGYTPERQQEVRGALENTVIVGGPGHMIREESTTPSGQERWSRHPETEQRVVSAIARSTMPAEHVQGLFRIHANPAEGHHATYWSRDQSIGMGWNQSHPSDRPDEHDRSLLHELGHHVDNVRTRETDRRASDIAEAALAPAPPREQRVEHLRHEGLVDDLAHRLNAGVGEAVADNYYQQHYRSPGRKGKAPTAGLYEEYQHEDYLRQNYPGYHDVRPPQSHMGPQFKQEGLW